MNARIAAILKDRVSEYTYVDRVAGRDVVTQQKMDGNDNYRKDWFSLSQKEVDELGADSKERMTGIAERFLEA